MSEFKKNEKEVKKSIVNCWNKHSDRVITKEDVYVAFLNKDGAILGIDGVSGYITYSHGVYTTSINELIDLYKESEIK